MEAEQADAGGSLSPEDTPTVPLFPSSSDADDDGEDDIASSVMMQKLQLLRRRLVTVDLRNVAAPVDSDADCACDRQ